MVIVGLTGKGTMTIDFTPVPLGAGHVVVFAKNRVQQFVPARGLDAWLIVFSPEFLALGSDLREVDAFDGAVAGSKSSDEVQSKIKARYKDLQLDVILKIGADAQYAK